MNQTKTIETLREALSEALNRHYRLINDDDEPATDEEKAYAHRLEQILALPTPQPDEQRVREAARDIYMACRYAEECDESWIAKRIAALAQADTDAEKLSQVVTWIPVSERLPKASRSKSYLVRWGETWGKAEWYCGLWWDGRYSHDVTHWAELPLPPAAQLSPKQEGGE